MDGLIKNTPVFLRVGRGTERGEEMKKGKVTYRLRIEAKDSRDGISSLLTLVQATNLEEDLKCFFNDWDLEIEDFRISVVRKGAKK